ncbi:hypothetical protein ACHAXT_011289 [Thalassiosira profunda]
MSTIRRPAYALNRPGHRPPSRRSLVLALCCVTMAILGIQRLLASPSGHTPKLAGSKNDPRCWLKRALQSGEFHLFSHRSYYDNTSEQPPTCHNSLAALKELGVNSLDLDLVLDERDGRNQLLVAHPMEFKQQSAYYSPCANTEFDEMMRILQSVFGREFFISMEPKAAWGNTETELGDAALTDRPSNILAKLLEKIKQHELKAENCAAIVEIREGHDEPELEKERHLLQEIVKHCQLFRGVRLADEPPASMGGYDILMPTIELHPKHSHNTDRKTIPRLLWDKSLFWVVDNEADLALAAEMHPFGVVSNSPKRIVEIVGSSNWCDK